MYRKSRDEWAWHNFGESLSTISRQISKYQYLGIFEPSESEKEYSPWHKPPSGAITLGEVASLLTADALGPPHGIDLLNPLKPPKLPRIPPAPDIKLMRSSQSYIEEKHEEVKAGLDQLKRDVAEKLASEKAKGAVLAAAYDKGAVEANTTLLTMTLKRHP